MEEKKPEEIRLKVAEAVQDDVNKGIIRIDSGYMRTIGINPGDVVEISGGRKTVGIADRAYPGDIGLSIIRIDGDLRRNAKTSIGETVSVKKADVKPAKKVAIAPATKGIFIRAPPNLFKQGLLGRALVKGDLISLGGTKRRRTAMGDNPIFEGVFSMLDQNFSGFGFRDIKFVVINTLPAKEVVMVTEETEVEFNPQAVEVKEEPAMELINYEDIGGLQDEIKKVREMVELPLKHPEIFERLGIEAPKGVLLHGPPGTGKTLLAKAVASETNSNFTLINGPEIMSKFYGESEKNLRTAFEEAEKNAPAIIFIDEIDAIAPKREEVKGEVERRVVAQLLSLMDGLKNRGKVVVIAATNRPNSIDPALRRPGRFDREIEIGVPSVDGRLDILKIHTRGMPIKGIIYPNIVAKKFSEIITNYLKENRLEQSKIDGKIEELKHSNEKRDILSNLIQKITFIKSRINKLEKIKKLIECKEVLDVLSKELVEIYHTLDIRGCLDPRKKFIETTKKKNEVEVSEILEEIKSLDLLEKEVWNKSSTFWNNIESEGKERDLKGISKITHGFVGADLSALAKEAAMIVLRRVLPDLELDGEKDEPIPTEVLEKLILTQKDFEEALKIVRPSAMREVLIEKPDVSWTDIGGMEEIKQKLEEAIEWPLKNPEVFKRMGVKPPKGILLYGAPGTGKTLLAKAVAKESEANFILVNGPALLSKWVGESEKAVREIFRKARQTAPTILFFDEIDSLAPRRGGMSDDARTGERVVNQILTEMDGLEALNDVIILAATNRPDIVDPALLRPGRFDRIIMASVPNEKAREKIFEVHTKNMPLEKDIKIKDLAKKTEGYVGADIEGVCREAAMLALREDINAKKIKMKHFEQALDEVKPSVDKEIEKTYKELEDHFKKAQAKQIQEERPSYMG